jgi:hypothetical protein
MGGGNLQRAYLDRGVRSNYERVVAVGAVLHDRFRDDRATTKIEPQPCTDERAGPKPLIIVGEYGLESDRTGALIDLIVDEFEPSLSEFDPIVLIVGLDDRRSAAGSVGDLGQILLWQREDHGDGIELGNNDEPAAIAGVHDVALIDEAKAGTAGQWRQNGGVAELDPRVVDDCLIVLNGCQVLPDQSLLRVHALMRRELLEGKGAEASRSSFALASRASSRALSASACWRRAW